MLIGRAFRTGGAERIGVPGDERLCWETRKEAETFSHSLEAQIGGQIAAGFAITGLYEDTWSDIATPLNRYFPVALATHALKASAGD